MAGLNLHSLSAMRKLSQFVASKFIARTWGELIATITISICLCKIHTYNRYVEIWLLRWELKSIFSISNFVISEISQGRISFREKSTNIIVEIWLWYSDLPVFVRLCLVYFFFSCRNIWLTEYVMWHMPTTIKTLLMDKSW